MQRRIAGLLAAILLMPLSVPAESVDPMSTIKTPIDQVISILNAPQYQAAGARLAQRNEIWKVVSPMFDFREISRRAVARHWNIFTEAEKAAFTDVFAQFLGNTYIDKIQGEYHNEQVVYVGQAFHSDAYAEVKTQLVRESVETPVNYRMFKDKSDHWKVYDITVEGVSLVKNYRTQFASILKKETPEQLIQRLNKKLNEQNRQLAGDG
jgi:phospholipid transport system substrate-binding protein